MLNELNGVYIGSNNFKDLKHDIKPRCKYHSNKKLHTFFPKINLLLLTLIYSIITTIDYEVITYANCSKLKKISSGIEKLTLQAKIQQNQPYFPSQVQVQVNNYNNTSNSPQQSNSYLNTVTGDINKYNTLALAESKKTIVGQRDDSSNLNLQGKSYATSAANALGNGKAISDSNSDAGVVGRALDNSEANARSLSSSDSDAFADNNAVSTSQANSRLLAGADASSGGSATVEGHSEVNSSSHAGGIAGDRGNGDVSSDKLGNPNYAGGLNVDNSSASAVSSNDDPSAYTSNTDGTTATNEEAKEKIISKMKSLYLGDPLALNTINPIKHKIDLHNMANNKENDLLYNQIKTPEYIDWEKVYSSSGSPYEKFTRYNTPKHVSEISVNILENNPSLIDLKFPEISANSELANLIHSQVQNLENNLEEKIQVNWVETDLVAQDITIDAQGYAYAAGLDGFIYEYENNITWEKVQGLSEAEVNNKNFDNTEISSTPDSLGNIIRVATGNDATPYAINGAGDTYYLNCNHRWEKLPGCAKDIAVGRGGEVYKLGCERRKGGFRIYKLICNYPCNKCKKCLRYKRNDKFRENKGNMFIVTPGKEGNNVYNDNDPNYNNISMLQVKSVEFMNKLSKSFDGDDYISDNKSEETSSDENDSKDLNKDSCFSDYSFSYAKDNKRCHWFNVAGGGVRIAVHPNGNPFTINEEGGVEYYNGFDWTVIPGIKAIDLAISNEGVLFFVGMDFSIYRLIPKKYTEDYSSYRLAKLTGQRAIAITVGPYSQPLIVGEGYKVYSSSKLGYN
jgi:hypothetical protein